MKFLTKNIVVSFLRLVTCANTKYLPSGDGIGSEVINEGIRVLSVLADRRVILKSMTNPWGSEYYLETGNMMASNDVEVDAIYFGSAGDPRIPDHLSLWGLRLAIVSPLINMRT